MWKKLGLILVFAGFATLAHAQATFTAKDATGATQTFKSINCSANICSIVVPVDSTGASILGVAGTANANVLTVQGIASMTPLLATVTGSVTVSGTVTANAGTNLNTSALALETGGNLAATSSGIGATGDAAATAGGVGSLTAKSRLMTTQLGTINTTLGSPFQAGGSIGNTSFAATQSGIWTVQPGNTANTTAWLVTGTGGTFPATLAAETTKVIGTVRIVGNVGAVFDAATAAAVPANALYAGMNQGGNLTGMTGTSGNLNVQCANCSGSGVSTADEATFTAGTSLFAGTGGFFQTTATNNALTNGQQGMWQMTANRAGFVNLRNAAGTEIGTSGTPVRIDPTGTTTQPVSITGNQAVNVAQVNGVTTLTGTGAVGTGAQRVAVGTDTATIAGSAPGTAGTASTNVVTVQGIASMTKLLVTPDSVALPANQSVNEAQINGVTPLMGNGVTGTGSQRVTIASDNTAFSVNATLAAETTKVIGTVRNLGNAGAAFDAATAAAVPANAVYAGAVSSGNLTGIIQADTSAAINVSTATTTQIVALTSGKKIYITSFDVVSGGTGNITFEYGTGSNCGTGTTVLTGAYNLTAQSGLAKGSGLGPVLVVPASNALCVLTSAAVQMSGSVAYTQF